MLCFDITLFKNTGTLLENNGQLVAQNFQETFLEDIKNFTSNF